MRCARGFAFGFVLLFVLVCALVFVFRIQPVKAAISAIYINADGSVSPSAPISNSGNVTYTFLDDMNACMIVERSNIIIDGAGHTLRGDGSTDGISLSYVDNVTIKHLNIRDFDGYNNGIMLWHSSGNTIAENTITNNFYGIGVFQDSSNNLITENNITANGDIGINMQLNSDNNTIIGNNIAGNGLLTGAMGTGIWIVQSCSNITIRGNNITDNLYHGVDIEDAPHSTISDNLITKNGIRGPEIVEGFWGYDGIYLATTESKVYRNNITDNRIGLRVTGANNNITENKITNNTQYGVILSMSSGDSFSGNIISGNCYNFGTLAGGFAPHTEYIDASNLVDGKRIYYLVGQKNLVINPTVYPDVGYLALLSCVNITVEDITLRDNIEGILVFNTNNTRITNTRMTNNEYNIEIEWCHNITLSGNTATEGSYGISLLESSNMTLRSNNMTGNSYDLSVSGANVLEVSHDIDISNTVSGKPVYFWVNRHDASVPLDAGYVALVNCTNITAKDLTITHNNNLLLFNTRNSHIINNTITDMLWGIQLQDSSNNTISQNNEADCRMGIAVLNSPGNLFSRNRLTNNHYAGIHFSTSSGNQVFQNQITNNSQGIYLQTSTCTVTANNITNNGSGIYVWGSGSVFYGNNITDNDVAVYFEYGVMINNKFYHNNFINNTQQVSSHGYHQIWDNGSPSGGNYWSDYKGKDTNKDGLGEKIYMIDLSNEDDHPLMGPFHTFNAGTWGEVSFNVDMVSNSTIANFSFNPDNATLSFDVKGENDTAGFCRVTIPTELMWCDNPSEWFITVGGTLTEAGTIIESGNYTYIYFSYTHSTKAVQIKSTHAVPEFSQPFTMLLLIIIAALLATVTYRVKMKKHV